MHDQGVREMQQAQKQSGEDLTLSQQGGQGDEVLMLSVCLIAMFFVLCYVSLLVCDVFVGTTQAWTNRP